MTVAEYSLLAASSLFVIVDPIATAPAFLAMTMDNTQAQRAQMARLACVTMAGVLLVFAVAGIQIFRLLGITLPAFQMAASIRLVAGGAGMLARNVHACRKPTRNGRRESPSLILQLRRWRFQCWRAGRDLHCDPVAHPS